MSHHPRRRSNNNPPISPIRNSSAIFRSESSSSNTPGSEISFGNNSGPSDEHRFSRFGFRSSLSEIERWLDNQVTISTTHLISYLSSPEGLHILRQITDNRPLSSQIVNKLAKLVTQDDIRSSVEKFDTNKIYGVFLGSAFLTQIQAHVGAMIEPKPEDLWPFVRLLEEMQNRTSDGWRFLPAETLREAIDEIPDGAEKFELYQQFCKLVEYRNKMKRLQQLSKLEDHYQTEKKLLEPPETIWSVGGRFRNVYKRRWMNSVGS